MGVDVSIMSYGDYAEVKKKHETASFPDGVYCDYATPLATLFFHPVPTQNANVLIFSEKPHAKPVDLYDELDFPEEFLRLLKYKLAVEVANEFGVVPSRDIIEIADSTLENIDKYTRRQVTGQ